MKKKILAFVYNRGFLALFSESHPKHGDGGWFVVTGAVEEGESVEDAVRREVKEETGLEVVDVFNLNWGSVYEWQDELFEEFNLITFVNDEVIKLNEEHSKFEWMELDSFVSKIKWDDDKRILKKVLEKAIKKELYFKNNEIKDYRRS